MTALSKEKLLASAQKNIDKAQIAKAIKDYEQIVKIDTRDMRHRQKLAELYARQNMIKEAFASFQMVARSFIDTGFYLKAIAVYKQMLKLEPGQMELYEQLAELNQKQGLIGNALAEYRSLILLLEKAKRYDYAATILQKMKKLDPENVGIRLKIVGLLANSEDTAEARQEFTDLLDLLVERQDRAGLLHVREQSRTLLQQETWVGKDLAQALFRLGEVDHGLVLLRELLKRDENDAEVLEALAAANRSAGNDQFADRFTTDPPALQGMAAKSAPGNTVPQTPLPSPTAEIESFEEEEIEELDILEELEEVDEELPAVQDDFDLEEIPLAFLETLKTSSLDEAPLELSLEAPETDFPVSSQKIMEIELDLDADFDLGADCESAPDQESVELPLADTGTEVELILDLEESAVDLIDIDDEEEGVLPQDDTELEIDLELPVEMEHEPADLTVVEPALTVIEPALAPFGANADNDLAAFSEDLENFGEQAFSSGLEDLASDLDEFLIDKDEEESSISEEDCESHFNLGIAYKEMGLLNDAVAEFGKAMRHPSRLVDAMSLKGICLAESGAMEQAEETFQSGLKYSRLNDEEKVCLHYELGLLYEGWERPAEALEEFQRVADTDQFFREVQEKMALLRQQLGLDESAAKKTARRNRVSFV